MKLLLIALLILVSSSILTHELYAKSKDSKAKDAIIKAMGKAVEGRYAQIDIVSLSKKNDSGTITFYNITKSTPVPQPPSPPPTPPPSPSTNTSISTTKVCLVGDFKGSTVPNMMKGCNYKIGLGDLGYASDLSYFKSLNFNKCVIGNHDAEEDGSKAIYQEALSYCGDHWTLKIGTSTLMIGLNTNGDINTQIQTVKTALASSTGLKTVILVSHKAGHVPPNSHHPAEAKSLYSQLEALMSPSISLYEIVGHNHVSSSAPSKNWYQAGAGGKSFYSCGTDAIWTYCDNSKLQYLELTIDNTNGNTAAKFVN